MAAFMPAPPMPRTTTSYSSANSVPASSATAVPATLRAPAAAVPSAAPLTRSLRVMFEEAMVNLLDGWDRRASP